MSDLRYDPIFGRWAVIAERRQSRPVEFQQFSQRRAGIDCPFCRGNESVTPPAIQEWSAEGPNPTTGSAWMIRVLPNKYPALDASVIIHHHFAGDAYSPADVRTVPAEANGQYGFQEVIVLSPRHVVSLSGLSNDELVTSFAAFQSRVAFHSQRRDVGHVCLFMNCRPLAGASIEHSHFQMIASPICTAQVRDRVARMNETCNPAGKTVWQSLLAWEAKMEVRVIAESDRYLVYCPFASRYSHQIRIATKQNLPFTAISKAARDELALLCRRWIDGIERCLEDPAYNLIFHLPPNDHPTAPWFVDLVPRFPQAAGFELATDCWVNPVSPETAARNFRQFSETL